MSFSSFLWRGFVSGCALFSTLLAWSAPDANQPASYALRLPVVLAPGTADAALQRLQLPARALVSLQSAAYADVRIFNAQGQPVPMALSQLASTPMERQSVTLPAYPILGASDQTTGTFDGFSLRIEEHQGKRVVLVNTGSPAAKTTAPQKIWGALLDARAVKQSVLGVDLDVDIPPGQPISFKLQASPDLKNWQTLADTVLFRPDGAAASLGSAGFELPSLPVEGRYLRISWTNATGQLAPVSLRAATLVTSSGQPRIPRVTATLASQALASPHELGFSLPFSTPVAALDILPQGENVLVPIRVLARQSGQPWTLLASTVAYRMRLGGKLQTSGAVDLPALSGFRDFKLEADKKTPGFTAPPDISVMFEPVQIVFLASGSGPYTLATGLPNTASAYLPLPSLIPGYQPGQENTLPLANLTSPATSSGALVNAAPASETTPTRSLMLWGVLLAGVLALAVMAWVLLKQNRV
ncbi:MAG: DUF3999 domain-containing protein [Pseudomonadota bacterium]